jgi:hypothetical protein
LRIPKLLWLLGVVDNGLTNERQSAARCAAVGLRIVVDRQTLHESREVHRWRLFQAILPVPSGTHMRPGPTDFLFPPDVLYLQYLTFQIFFYSVFVSPNNGKHSSV